jgi:hypothetical protein
MTIAAALRTSDSQDTLWTQHAEAIHHWYRIIMGFDWRLADFILNELSVTADDLVLDPFAGAGTTLVQCKKRGISAVGIDVNPVCTLASTVKTSWTLKPTVLKRNLDQIVTRTTKDESHLEGTDAAALRYLQTSGMIERGWLSLHKARIVLSVRRAIRESTVAGTYRNFFYLALVSAVVSKIADVKFGPEIYCVRPRKLPALSSFIEVAELMISEMQFAHRLRSTARSNIYLGDSRSRDTYYQALPSRARFAITSPPYPNEHDYTRSTRLELIMLGHVRDIKGLRSLKHDMLRCTTKGLYKDDSDAEFAKNYPSVERVAQELDRRAAGYSDGFSQLYGRMVREYFGGMARHLLSLHHGLVPGARCAYVIRDTRALLGVYIDTPTLVGEIAASPKVGYELEKIIEWKKVKGTTGNYQLKEKILIFRKPGRGW